MSVSVRENPAVKTIIPSTNTPLFLLLTRFPDEGMVDVIGVGFAFGGVDAFAQIIGRINSCFDKVDGVAGRKVM